VSSPPWVSFLIDVIPNLVFFSFVFFPPSQPSGLLRHSSPHPRQRIVPNSPNTLRPLGFNVAQSSFLRTPLRFFNISLQKRLLLRVLFNSPHLKTNRDHLLFCRDTRSLSLFFSQVAFYFPQGLAHFPFFRDLFMQGEDPPIKILFVLKNVFSRLPPFWEICNSPSLRTDVLKRSQMEPGIGLAKFFLFPGLRTARRSPRGRGSLPMSSEERVPRPICRPFLLTFSDGK